MTFKQRYQKRVDNNVCVRCGKAKETDESRRKCLFCRQIESTWRKDTRKLKNRDVQEQKYHMKSWAKRCVHHSRRSDVAANRTFSEQEYVTETQLTHLRKIQKNRCYYCRIVLQVFNRRRPDGLTVERIVGLTTPHLSNNIVLCCHRCNCKKMGNRIKHKPPLQRYFEMWTKYKTGTPTIHSTPPQLA